MKNRNRLILLMVSAVALIMLCPVMAFADGDEYVPAAYETFWSLLPPIVAIVLALITKEVFSSLFIGVVIGAVIYGGGNFELTINHLLQDGIITSLTDGWNIGILVFLVILGIIVALLNRSGGSIAFGKWASTHIKTKRGASLATIALGILIFVDDYFNCLTVGSVMLPVAEEAGISKTKLAYLIDATAAPVCILAPISSWAAAVSGYVEGQNGLHVFIQAIPYNFYAILTIVMMISLVFMDFDYGLMKKKATELIEKGEKPAFDLPARTGRREGRVIDLVLPIVILIVSCVIGMIYTGGFFEGETFVNAFANCDAATGLAMGSLVALCIIIIYYILRGVIAFKSMMECIPEGFKAMVTPILILTLAWTLKSMTDSLGIAEFVARGTESVAGSVFALLPAVIFAIACFLGFSSGTSWGTFGILIPIVVAVFGNTDPDMLIIGMSACMAGGVCGDHCSPISDTTIMASAGSKCDHVDHVSTQLPYAITVAAISFVTYIVAGFTKSAWISLPFGIVVLLVFLFAMKKRTQKEDAAA